MNKIIMFYDDSCAICRTEAQQMQENHADKIAIISVDEGLEELKKAGISRLEAMTYLCVQDIDGNMVKGIEAV